MRVLVLTLRQLSRQIGRQREGSIADDSIDPEPNKRVDAVLIIDLRHQHAYKMARYSSCRCYQLILRHWLG